MMTLPRRALLVFLDGVGIGPADPAVNPFAAAWLPRLRALLGGRLPVADDLDADGRIRGSRAVLAAADATLGVPGRPQSGTGQTALLTGRNAPRMFGRHFGSWVPTTLRGMLARENLLTRAAEGGLRAAFANAYPLAAGEADPRIFRRPAAPPLAALGAGVLDRGLPELLAGRAVASSITNEHWSRPRPGEVPAVTAEDAGRTLARIATTADVTLFAHYDTDHVGHAAELASAIAALEKVDAFVGALADALPDDVLLVIASDHGNLEDVRGGHTTNPVPVIAVGPGAEALASGIRALTDVAPGILGLLGIPAADTDPSSHDPET
jgi:2,3-bisphosphoglycerate-independent phosphoglycerate mutase